MLTIGASVFFNQNFLAGSIDNRFPAFRTKGIRIIQKHIPGIYEIKIGFGYISKILKQIYGCRRIINLIMREIPVDMQGNICL
jgi:hypothetical protein